MCKLIENTSVSFVLLIRGKIYYSHPFLSLIYVFLFSSILSSKVNCSFLIFSSNELLSIFLIKLTFDENDVLIKNRIVSQVYIYKFLRCLKQSYLLILQHVLDFCQCFFYERLLNMYYI